MVPIVLDGAQLPLALIGRGEALARRLDWLEAGAAQRLTVFCEEPGRDLRARLGPALVERLPTATELASFKVVWITGLAEALAKPLAATARRVGTLVNVEDLTEACDFHTPAVVRRGDLLLTVSTAARSPGLAARVRSWLEEAFGPEWACRLDDVARKRAGWRRQERPLPELAALTDAMVDKRRWLVTEDR